MGVREFGWWTEFLVEKGVKGVSKDLWYLVSLTISLFTFHLFSTHADLPSDLFRHCSLSSTSRRCRTRSTSTTTMVSLPSRSHTVCVCPSLIFGLACGRTRSVAFDSGRLYGARQVTENQGGRDGPRLSRRWDARCAMMIMPSRFAPGRKNSLLRLLKLLAWGKGEICVTAKKGVGARARYNTMSRGREGRPRDGRDYEAVLIFLGSSEWSRR
jgi:hypothetical protein